ncbi:hypothetical protein FRX31_026872, partial [Thalictrum thalictroides]
KSGLKHFSKCIDRTTDCNHGRTVRFGFFIHSSAKEPAKSEYQVYNHTCREAACKECKDQLQRQNAECAGLLSDTK